MRGADWRAHIAGPGRRCLECLGQYDPALVQSEREGRFDDPEYMAHLADEDPLRRNENVFAFSLGCAALEMGQFLSMVVAPGGIASYGAQMYHFAVGTLEHDERVCNPSCLYSGPWLTKGETVGIVVTAHHQIAEDARAARVTHSADEPHPRGSWIARLRERLRCRVRVRDPVGDVPVASRATSSEGRRA